MPFPLSAEPPSGRRVLVTGATGFIGRAVTAHLAECGYTVFGTRRPGATTRSEAVVWRDIDDLLSVDWSPLLEEVDFVVHLAALAHQIGQKTPSDAYDKINHQGVVRLVEAIERTTNVRRLLFVSSIGAVCSTSVSLVTEHTPCTPDSPYGLSKRAAETAIDRILKSSTTDWCILRPTLVYGPENPGNMLRLVKLIRSGLPLPLGAIRNRRSLLYVGNLADAIKLCLEHPGASRETFNISDGQAFSTPELLTELSRASSSALKLFSFPPALLRTLGKMGDLATGVTKRPMPIDTYSVERLLSSLEVDISALQRKTGWQPPFTAKEAFRRTFS